MPDGCHYAPEGCGEHSTVDRLAPRQERRSLPRRLGRRAGGCVGLFDRVVLDAFIRRPPRPTLLDERGRQDDRQPDDE